MSTFDPTQHPRGNALTGHAGQFAEKPQTKPDVKLTEGPNSYIPEALNTYISEVIGHEDFAPYVLDGQTSSAEGEDDWHDVIAVEDGANGEKVTKFTMDPDGTITHRALS